MKGTDMYVFYVKNAKTGEPKIVETFNTYEEAEKYWEDISPHRLPLWGIHFHFEANKEREYLDITKEVIFGKAQVELPRR